MHRALFDILIACTSTHRSQTLQLYPGRPSFKPSQQVSGTVWISVLETSPETSPRLKAVTKVENKTI